MARITQMLQWASRGTAVLALAALCLTAPAVSGEEVTTECLYEFNRAYSWNEGAQDQLNLARQQAANLNTEAAKQRYEQAIDLLEKSIEHYERLPELAFDCSPTNLSIARNNIRTARENLQFARESLAGLDCIKALDELESLTDLASEYYYEHNDTASAQQSADDAVTLAESIAERGICTGGYRETLAEQTRYARKVADSLIERSRYDRCMRQLEQARQSYERANRVHPGGDKSKRRQAWRQALDKAEQAVGSGNCKDTYLEQAADLRRRAQQQVNRLN